ncbi:MAG: hypothetical protein K6E85_07425 [Lachnospiraceae bacterium]|nr:hypothetical protein [Lachnospiraceae bacterium]
MENSKMQEMVSDLIRFLQKWGLWSDTTILANGNRYSYSSDRTCGYGVFHYVEYEENVKPEDYTSGITQQRDSDGKLVWRSFSNPEHILDMVYEGPLCMLLSYDTYETKKSEISEEAWEYIFDHTDILDEYLYEKYECYDASDLLAQILEDKFDNPDYTAWDPLVFDTWEEYLEFVNGEAYETGEEELTPTYQRYGTYAEYLADMEMSENLSIEDIEPVWEKMVSDAKKEYISECASNETKIISIPGIAGHIRSEFDKIFDRYGLWYDFGFSWSLTCYKK